MYQKGDAVRIRDDLIVGEEYGLCPVKMEYDMKECLGKTGIVTDVMPEELAVKVNDWWWSEVMVTPAVSTHKAVAMTNWGKLSGMTVDDAAKELTCLFSALIAGLVDKGCLSMHKSDYTINNAIGEFLSSYLIETEGVE